MNSQTEDKEFFAKMEEAKIKLYKANTNLLWASGIAAIIEILIITIDILQKDWKLMGAHLITLFWIGLAFLTTRNQRKWDDQNMETNLRHHKLITKLLGQLEAGTKLILELAGKAGVKVKVKEEFPN